MLATISSALPDIASDSADDTRELVTLLGRWLALGEVERRAFLAMAEELSATSRLIEDSTASLTSRFRELATAATLQARRVQDMAAIAREIDVGGQRVTTTEVVGVVEAAVVEAGEAFRRVSGQAGTMVRALDEVVADMAEVEKLVGKIEGINTKARYVALNAAIEASRGENGGGTFKVIAHELKDLSQQTDTMSRQVRERVAGIAAAVRAAHQRLRDVAEADAGSSGDGATRARLGEVLSGLLAQNTAMNAVLDQTSAAASEIAQTVAQLVTGAQFQDRASQHLGHVSDALATVGDIAGALRDDTHATVPELRTFNGLDQALVERLLGRQTLSAVRRRFLDRLAGGEAMAPAPTEDAGGDVELF